MAFWDFLFGRKPRTTQLPTLTPQQQAYQNQALSGAMGGPSNLVGMDYLRDLFSDDPEAWQAYEAPYMRQFNEQIVPGIATRFAGMGSHGSFGSGLNQSLSMAAQRLSESLAGQRANLRSGAYNQLMQTAGMGMQPAFNYMRESGVPGMAEDLGRAGAYRLLGMSPYGGGGGGGFGWRGFNPYGGGAGGMY